MRLSREEITRKLLHLFALVMPAGIYFFPMWSLPPFTMSIILFGLFIGSVAIELVRFRSTAVQALFFKLFGSMLRKEEHIKITGSTWVIGAAFLCSVLFHKTPYISFIVLSLFILGDAAAALVGISIGRIKIGKKSLEGSLACFFLCALLFYVAFPFVPGLFSAWGGNAPTLIIWVTAFVIMLFELVPLKIAPKIIINDNLAVPVIAGYTILILEKMI